jgi:hypothetical protein
MIKTLFKNTSLWILLQFISINENIIQSFILLGFNINEAIIFLLKQSVILANANST